MDPFNKLPPELRLQIFIQLRCRRSIFQLVRASPVMLKQYILSIAYIDRKLLTSDLDDDMIQDAMGIILFHCWDRPSSACLTLIRRHFHKWAAQQLPDPFKKHNKYNQELVHELHKLHSRLIFFIEDYLTKATALFPPREYLCLPDLLSIKRNLVFKGRIVTTRFDAANLTDSERKRLLRAFLRFELICKICQYRNSHGGNRRLWNCESLYKCRGQKFQASEREALGCVYGYLESLYGAMFAQYSDSWLPDIPVGSLSSHLTGLLYPDNIHVDASTYAFDIGLKTRCISLELASFGFDLATACLRSATERSDRLKRLFKYCDKINSCDFPFRRLYLGGGQYIERDPKHIKDIQHYQEESPGMSRGLYRRISNSSPLHLNIYRQRAWVFLDDGRLYPSSGAGPHFPTRDELDELSAEIRLDSEWFMYPFRTRALHRSQKWHDEQHGMSSDNQTATRPQDSELETSSPTEERYFRNPVRFWR